MTVLKLYRSRHHYFLPHNALNPSRGLLVSLRNGAHNTAAIYIASTASKYLYCDPAIVLLCPISTPTHLGEPPYCSSQARTQRT